MTGEKQGGQVNSGNDGNKELVAKAHACPEAPVIRSVANDTREEVGKYSR
jgi:hypothetical protein